MGAGRRGVGHLGSSWFDSFRRDDCRWPHFLRRTGFAGKCSVQTAEAALARLEVAHRDTQVLRPEIGPAGVDEAELRVGALPEQEIGQAALAAGADQQVQLRYR